MQADAVGRGPVPRAEVPLLAHRVEVSLVPLDGEVHLAAEVIHPEVPVLRVLHTIATAMVRIPLARLTLGNGLGPHRRS